MYNILSDAKRNMSGTYKQIKERLYVLTLTEFKPELRAYLPAAQPTQTHSNF